MNLHCCHRKLGIVRIRPEAEAVAVTGDRRRRVDLFPILTLLAKLIIISANTPPLRKSELEYYAMLAKCNVHHYAGNNIELGTACGKLFRVGCLSIIDGGDSDILSA